jgi:hypothetical protein
MVKYSSKILQVYLPVILTIVTIVNVGFVASASADNKVKVKCEKLELLFHFSRNAINELNNVDPGRLQDIEDDLEISHNTVFDKFDKILDKC